MADGLQPYDGPIVPLASHENLKPYDGEILPHDDVRPSSAPGATRDNPLDDTAHAAGAATIAHASLETKPDLAIRDYAAAFKQPVEDFGIIGGHIVRKVPETGEYARVEPSVRGATGPLDAAKRAFDWVAGGAGPAIPAVASGAAATLAAIVAAPETFGAGSIPAAMAASGVAGAGAETVRQKFANALRPEGAAETPLDLENIGMEGGASALAPLGGKLIGAAAGRIAPIVKEGLKDIGQVGAAETGAGVPLAAAERSLVTSGATGATTKGVGADAVMQRIKNAAQKNYKAAEDAGVVISPESFGQFAEDLPNGIHGYHPAVNEQAAKLVKMLQSEATAGPMTLQKLDALRSVASGLSAGRDLNEARLAGDIVGKIDNFIDNLGAKDLVGTSTEDAQAAAEALSSARSTWRVYSKLRTINDIVDTGEVLNDQNWVKGRFRALVKSAQFDHYTPDEQAAIASVAKTGNLEKAIKLIPWRGVQMASTYAEPMMQGAKINSLRDLIAQGAAEEAPAVIPKPSIPALSDSTRNLLTQAGLVTAGSAAEEASK